MTCVLLISLLACHVVLIMTNDIHLNYDLTNTARTLIEEQVGNSGVGNFISSHPVLSQLTHFDLVEHDTENRRMLSDLTQLDDIEYSITHSNTEYKLNLSRKKVHGESGLPHFIYNLKGTSNSRVLEDEISVEYYHVNCIYSGNLQDQPDNIAIISFCEDDVRGVIKLAESEDEVHIQPIDVKNKRMLASWMLSSIIKDSDRTCGTPPSDRNHSSSTNFASANSDEFHDFGTSLLLQAQSRIDVFMVNDKARTDRYTIFGIFSQTLFLFSLVENLYSGFPGQNAITIQPTGILSMAFRDAWNQDVQGQSVRVDGSGGLLQNFGTFMNTQDLDLRDPQGNEIRFDVAHLLSGEDFVNSQGNQGVVGLAQVGGVCGSPNVAIGTTQDLFIDANTATVLAHEIGHNLGFEHTDQPINSDPDSACEESNIKRIMDSSGTTAQSWSQCSEFWWLQTLGTTKNCFFITDPLVPVNGPYCGNGIVEEGEQCDCGAIDCSVSGQISGQALDPCCDGSTCQYLGTSQCAANDPCCNIDTCSFADNTTVCRPKRDDSNCDTEEVCSGTSGECPTDILEAFGTSCTVNGFGGRCYRGGCISPGDQCNAVGLTDACSNAGSGDAFCQGISGSGIRCQANQASCLAGSFPQISPADGTECDNGKGCYLGSCVTYSEIPLVDVCFNFEQDENETDIDCGGELCLPCTAGKTCRVNSDCFSQVCEIVENSNVSVCIGDAVVEDEDIFDVIGRYLAENPFIAFLVYLVIIGFIGYFIYHDYKARKKKHAKRKEIGSVRQETYRNSIRMSQALSARPVSIASHAQSTFSPVEVPELSAIVENSRNSRRRSIPLEDSLNVTDNPRYSGNSQSSNRRVSAEVPNVDQTTVPVPRVAEVMQFNDEIEDKI